MTNYHDREFAQPKGESGPLVHWTNADRRTPIQGSIGRSASEAGMRSEAARQGSVQGCAL